MRMNLLPRLGLAAFLALASPATAEDPANPPGPEAPPPALPEEPAPEAPLPNPVPSGSKEDRALWTSCDEIASKLGSARWGGARLHWTIKADGLYARLEAAAKADPGSAKRIDEVRTRLVEAQTSSYEDLTGRWPVDKTRTCRYSQLELGSAMEVAAEQDNRANLARARDAAARCLELAQLTLRRVQRSSEALARALEAVEKVLPPSP
jgi:hypothetical protein